MKLTLSRIQSLETEMLKEVVEICERNNLNYYLAYGTALGAIRHGGPIPWDADADIVIPYNQLDRFIKTVRAELSDNFFLDYHDINKYFTPTFPRIGLQGYSTAILHIDVFILVGLPSDKKLQIKHLQKLALNRKRHYRKTVSSIYREKFSLKGRMYNCFFKLVNLPYSLKKIREEFDYLCALYPLESSDYVAVANSIMLNKATTPKKFYGKGIIREYSNIKVNLPEQYDDYLRHFYGNYMQYPLESERKAQDTYTIIKLNL